MVCGAMTCTAPGHLAQQIEVAPVDKVALRIKELRSGVNGEQHPRLRILPNRRHSEPMARLTDPGGLAGDARGVEPVGRHLDSHPIPVGDVVRCRLGLGCREQKRSRE